MLLRLHLYSSIQILTEAQVLMQELAVEQEQVASAVVEPEQAALEAEECLHINQVWEAECKQE